MWDLAKEKTVKLQGYELYKLVDILTYELYDLRREARIFEDCFSYHDELVNERKIVKDIKEKLERELYKHEDEN